ncbi:MAG: ankyrin repeat domain-containing protein, partial [Kangiellaceae bacterium]|nr:ankyrin repeat domain-containing protein [Kangiellaceae bacterium]
GSAPIVNWLLDKGLTLPDNFRDYGDTLLTLAKHSDTTLLARLFKAGLSPDKENTASIPLLAYAIDTNNQSLTRLLLQSRSDPNQYFQNFDNQTPLLLAISKQHTSLATLLIEHGANVNQRDGGSLGISPLMLAIEQSNVSLVDALLANGAAVDATDNEGKSVNQRLTIGSAIEKKISGALNSKSRAVQVNLNITNGRSSQTALDVSDNKELALRPLDSDTYGIDAIELWDETNQRALRMLDKASNSISAVIIAKFLNDREAILSVNENSPLKIVDLNSGAVKKRITFDLQPKTKTRIQVAALSNNKQYLAMASDNAVNLVDLTKQKIVKHWPSLNAKELQFSPSNQVLYAVGSDSNLVSLGITDNKRADFDHFYDHRIKEPEFIIGLGNEKFLLAEGDSSLSSSSRSKVWLFDAASRKIMKVFDLGFSTIETIATNRNHSYLAVATHKYFKVFDLKQGNLIWQSPINDISSNYSINDVTFISENRVILSNQISNKIDMVDIPSRSRLTTHTVESVNGIKHSLSDNENGLILSGGNQLIRFKVDATNGTPQINKITQRSMETDIIALLKHQQDIIAIESNNQISLNTAQELTQQWRKDLYTDSDLRESCLDNRTIVSAVTLSKRSLVIQCYSFTTFDGKSGLYKWDVDTSKLTKINSEWSTESINSFHIDQVTKKLYTVGPGISSNTYMKEITLSESKTENGEPGNKYRTQHLIKNQSNLTQPINALAANENVLLSGSRDKRQLHLWDDNFQSLKLQNENIEQYVSGIALSNNNHLSVNWQTNWLEIWDIKQSKFHSLIRTEGSITTAVFSKNGKHLLVATEDGKVHNYSVDSSELNYSTTPAQSRVRAIALSPNGKQFVTASRSIQRRNTKTGELINEIHLASGLAESIQFDMTGNIRAGIVRRLDENGARLSRIEIINPESGQVIRSRNKLELLTQSTDGEHYVTYSNLNGIQVWQNIDDKLVRQIAFENFNRWDNGVAINKNYLYVSGVEFLQKFSLKESVAKDAKSEFLVGSGRPFKPTMSYSNDRNWALNMVSADYSEWFDVSNNKRLGCTQGNLLEYQSINIDPTNSQLILNKGEQQFQLMPDSKDCQKPVAMPANDSSQKIHQQLWRHQIKFRGYRAGIASLSVMAPSHSHFAMVKDNYLHVASLQTGSLIGPLKAESQMVGLRFSLSGRKLVSLHYDGSFSIWDSETGVNLFNATTEYFNHETIEFDTNEQYLSIDSSYQTVIEEKCTPICNKVTKQVQRAKQRWSLNERKLISIKRSSGKPVDLQKEISRLDQRGNSLALKTDSIYQKIGWGQGAAILSDDQQMTAAFDKGKLLFWKDNDKTTRPEIIYEKASYQPPSLLAFIKDNQFLLIVEKNGDISFYDTKSVKRVARMKIAEDSTWVALDEQGRYDSNSPGDLPFASWVSDDS